ncbi:hypothetical protein [Luteolibacter soli]|uniref:Uncharacterized protein n=1 Tax=Luteolibacter soli TaxID=3135280 RepID=A0ABU9ARZ9_9BACT
MDEDFHELEATLKGMRPVMPDAACMDRLLAAMERRMPVADLSIERELGKLTPSALMDGVQERLLETVARVPFPVDEKVVLFPGKTKQVEKVPARRPWLAAAAAVAVLGAFSALMMDGPRTGTAGPVAGTGKSDGGTPVTSVHDPRLVDASVGSQVKEAQDEGLSWTRDGKPMRRVRLIYMDKVKYVGDDGKTVEMERPRVEWLLVPEKID